MGAIVVAAIGLAALANPSEAWAGVLWIVAYGLLGLAILGAVICKQAARAWWLGWAVFEWGYLWIATSAWWAWGLPFRFHNLPTVRLLEILRVKLGAPAKTGMTVGFDEEAAVFGQTSHYVWAIGLGVIGAVLARLMFAMSSRPAASLATVQPTGARQRRPWLGATFVVLLALAVIAAIVAIWSTPEGRIWAGGVYLLTWGVFCTAALGALFARGKYREICIGATLFGAGYLYLAMAHSRFPGVENPRPYFITDQFLNAVRPLVPWNTVGTTAADSHILRALEKPISMKFTDGTSLGELVAYIKKATSTPNYPEIPIYVDPIGLAEAERNLDSTVSIDLQGVPLKTTLRLCLRPLGLMYFIEDGCLQITSVEEEDTVPPRDDPFLVVGHSLFALVAAAVGGVIAPLVSAGFRRRGGPTDGESTRAPASAL
jgi:hypothetical protein